MTTKDISNDEDTLDSRDIDERIEELESARDEFILNETTTDDDSPSWGELADGQSEAESKWNATDEGEELTHLTALRDGLKDYCPDWSYGVTLIRDSYFTEYCKELVKDIGDMPKDIPSYIENNIDWDGVADDLRVDYTSEEFDGVTYWAR